MKRFNKQGFSMIELLVVLLIIGILAAVAAPLFLQNSTKAKVSEAVAGAGEIRQAERTYYAQTSPNGYLTVTGGATADTYFGTGGANAALLGVLIHGNKYFSPQSYAVNAAAGADFDAHPGGTAAALDFVIKVSGAASDGLTGVTGCAGTDAVDGASSCADVATFIIEMDNSGQTIYFDGTTWNKY